MLGQIKFDYLRCMKVKKYAKKEHVAMYGATCANLYYDSSK